MLYFEKDLHTMGLFRHSTMPMQKCCYANNSAPWEIFHAFLSSADFFSKSTFSKILSGIASDQIRQNIGPDLGPICLQRLRADDTSRQRVKKL